MTIPKSLYVGSLNDGLCIIDQPPRPAPVDTMVPGNPHGVTVIAKMCGNRSADQTLVVLFAASPDLLEAAELLERAESQHANCPECDGEGVPELCAVCFPFFDAARCTRRVAIVKAGSTLSGWLPIGDAQRDGSEYVIWIEHDPRLCHDPEWSHAARATWIDHNGGGWTWHGLCGRPTHYMPNPPANIAGLLGPDAADRATATQSNESSNHGVAG